MSAVWQCTRCFALHFGGERVCRRCGAPRPAISVPTVEPRAPDSTAAHLHLPPLDFPYTRRAATRERRRIGPAVLLVCAALVAVGWDPLIRRIAASRALGGESDFAIDVRRRHLALAVSELDRLAASRGVADPAEWREDVRAVGPRWRLAGNPGNAALGDLEVRVRAVWLALGSLPTEAGAAGPHVSLAREELSRVTEDLSNAR